MSDDVVIDFEHVSKSFPTKNGVTEAVKDVNLQIARNEFVCVVGPSGCGKTTLLQLCAGLVRPTNGSLLYKGKPILGINTDAGYITQDSNLYPWRTLLENVEFSLEMRRMPKEERHRAAHQLLDLMGLTGFENHLPYQLSGGMQKRTSIARTLVYDPDVVLMDEPFGALDAQTRMVLQNELLKVCALRTKTILFITHDIVEAIALADRVVLMTARPGTIKEIFCIDLPRPRNIFEIHSQPGFADVYRRIWEHFKIEIKVG